MNYEHIEVSIRGFSKPSILNIAFDIFSGATYNDVQIVKWHSNVNNINKCNV